MTNSSSGEKETADIWAKVRRGVPQSTAFSFPSSSPQLSSQLQSDSQVVDPGLRVSTVAFQVPLFSVNDFPQRGCDEVKP